MEILQRSKLHKQNRSYDTLIGMVAHKGEGRIIVKFTYEAYNAVERCTTEMLDGNIWNHIFCMWDLGIEPNNSAYNIWDEKTRQKRADDLFNASLSLITKII